MASELAGTLGKKTAAQILPLWLLSPAVDPWSAPLWQAAAWHQQRRSKKAHASQNPWPTGQPEQEVSTGGRMQTATLKGEGLPILMNPQAAETSGQKHGGNDRARGDRHSVVSVKYCGGGASPKHSLHLRALQSLFKKHLHTPSLLKLPCYVHEATISAPCVHSDKKCPRSSQGFHVRHPGVPWLKQLHCNILIPWSA